MNPNDRRLEIIEILCLRRQETMPNLAHELGVSIETIKRDITILSLSYPIETIRSRYGGGIRIREGYKLNQKFLKPTQQDLLERLRPTLSGEDLATLESIFHDFALNA